MSGLRRIQVTIGGGRIREGFGPLVPRPGADLATPKSGVVGQWVALLTPGGRSI
jgi:hypothetical protein